MMVGAYFEAVGRDADTAVVDFLASSSLRPSQVSPPVTGRGRGDEPGSFRVAVSAAPTDHEEAQRAAVTFIRDNRAELDRLLRSDELWDGRVGVLQVTDAISGYVRVRILVSASNAGDLFDLRCNVREGMVEWLQHAQAGALPRRRLEHSPSLDGSGSDDQSSTGQPRADANLFNGSPGAEQRGRVFAGPNGRDGN